MSDDEENNNYLPSMAEDIQSLIEKELYEGRALFFNDDVDDDSIKDLIMKITWLDFHNDFPITVYFNTDGGSVYNFLELYDFTHSIKSKVNIHITGRAFSAGALILACCATGERTSGRNASFMIHNLSTWVGGSFAEVEDDYKECVRLTENMERLLAKHTKLTRKKVKALSSRNTYFDALTAREWGFIDRIR